MNSNEVKKPKYVSEIGAQILAKGAVFTFIQSVRNVGKTTWWMNYAYQNYLVKGLTVGVLRLTKNEATGQMMEIMNLYGYAAGWLMEKNSMIITSETGKPLIRYHAFNMRGSGKSTLEIKAHLIIYDEYDDVNLAPTNHVMKFNMIYKTMSRERNTPVIFLGNLDNRANELLTAGFGILPPVGAQVWEKSIFWDKPNGQKELMVYYIKMGKEFFDNSTRDNLASAWLDQQNAQMFAYAHGAYLKGHIDNLRPIDTFIGNIVSTRCVVVIFEKSYVFGKFDHPVDYGQVYEKGSFFVIDETTYNFKIGETNELPRFAITAIGNLDKLAIFDPERAVDLMTLWLDNIKKRRLFINTQDVLIDLYKVISLWGKENKSIKI